MFSSKEMDGLEDIFPRIAVPVPVPDSSSKNLVYILPTGIYSGRAPSRSANVSGLKALGPGFVLFDVTHDQGAHVISR